MSENYIPVRVKSDDDGHDYIIPNEHAEAFRAAIEKGEETGDYSDADRFSKYSVGGCVNNYQLCIAESELKKLTG